MLKLWTTISGQLMLYYPHTIFLGKSMTKEWGFSYSRYSLVVNQDTTTPYSILHIGPWEFFIRPRCVTVF
jgi:hypothetical protein